MAEQEVKQVKILSIKNGTRENTGDIVSSEVSFQLYVNSSPEFNFLCTPAGLEELAAGFLYSAGYIEEIDDLQELQIDRDGGAIHTAVKTPAVKNNANNNIPRDNLQITPGQLHYLGEHLNSKDTLFYKTGGTHGAALCSTSDVICFFEDVGRHNTLDKVTGYCLLNNISRSDKLLIFSGRISAKIIKKVSRIGVPLVASPGAPTGLALELAQESGITVVGFLRNNRMNVYTMQHRIL